MNIGIPVRIFDRSSCSRGLLTLAGCLALWWVGTWVRQDILNRALLRACIEGEFVWVAPLLKVGADPNIKPDAGPTVLGWTVYVWNRPDIAELLRKSGAKEDCGPNWDECKEY